MMLKRHVVKRFVTRRKSLSLLAAEQFRLLAVRSGTGRHRRLRRRRLWQV